MDRLRAKLAAITDSHGVSLDDTTSSDLYQIMEEEEQQVAHRFPQGSFQQIFWQQQKESASRSGKDKRGMRWHPLMVNIILYAVARERVLALLGQVGKECGRPTRLQ